MFRSGLKSTVQIWSWFQAMAPISLKPLPCISICIPQRSGWWGNYALRLVIINAPQRNNPSDRCWVRWTWRKRSPSACSPPPPRSPCSCSSCPLGLSTSEKPVCHQVCQHIGLSSGQVGRRSTKLKKQPRLSVSFWGTARWRSNIFMWPQSFTYHE